MFIEGRVAGQGGPRKQYNAVRRKHPPCLYNQPWVRRDTGRTFLAGTVSLVGRHDDDTFFL